ncbi:site-specific integrase [Bacillus sp. AFS040349]|uniref:tyrosine-type recombinase/integrase n=1 Tax=Bacillus sp. AFS040349 TaxID=2033502 RepID=UPI000BFE263B|nr:site-specific integrase [Bacillus sp. AFS040349]PGT89191.1 site-specific integrase [Bacillus sp. AFS040349]
MYCRKVDTKKGKVWECTEEIPKDPVTGKRKRVSARGKTKPEAKIKLERKIDEIVEYGLTTDPQQSQITFEKLANEWLETHKRNTKNSAFRSNQYHIKRFGKYIAKIPVRNITKKAYQNVIDQMSNDGYSYNTIYSAHSVAKKIFKQAIAWDIIKSSPADMVVLPKQTLTIEEIESDQTAEQYLEREELKSFLNIVDKHGLPSDDAIFTILAFTGMRIGELLALKWKDIDFNSKEINVTKTIYNIDGKKDEYQLLPPKTKKSIRKISIDDHLIKLLNRQKNLINEQKMRVRNSWHDEDFVITREDGYPMSPRFVHYRIKRIEKFLKAETNCKKKLHPHILRHTHTSMLTEAGADLRAIMQRLGHTDAKTTLSVYTHVTEKMKIDTSDKLAKAFGDLINR